MKKVKKYIILILLLIFIGIFVLFYFFDPLEQFHNYTLPSGDSDFVLCYYQADLGAKDKTYYIIDEDGNIKKNISEFPLNYSKLAEWNSKCKIQFKSDKISNDMIEKIKIINPNNCRTVSHVGESEIAYPESCYYVVHIKDDEISMQSIKIIYYNGSLGNSPKLVSVCRSQYTDDICELIDKKVYEYESYIHPSY
ncbi:hypothetical protein SAMN02910447_02261 [Ruminococcus sp. YE71]|uniref:hypothetical protein n=1 Tax=unclassified Ruminococcus TaxID=2608920 RepID=UPI000884F11E|nr:MULTISPECIES: hypothetical protein [unclassified Ruminococcus]SDA23003.1 hypothetical protein SAMN02910446_02129 [Ruminococcus sp. YE78]SFW39116.1 hypothetical protein SAMN02910447_02261 [Ruminococcus sp. YE71]